MFCEWRRTHNVKVASKKCKYWCVSHKSGNPDIFETYFYIDLFMSYHRACYKSSTVGTTSGVGNDTLPNNMNTLQFLVRFALLTL